MKTLLVFPPNSDPAHPPLGIASLAGYLRGCGEEVGLLDLNLRSYGHLLSPGNLARCAERLEQRIAELESRIVLPGEDFEEYRLAVEHALSAEHLCAAVPEALDALRDPATYQSRARYHAAASAVRRGMELVSAAHYPVRWYPRGFSTSYLPTSTADVLAATVDGRRNLFLSFLTAEVEEIAGEPPDIVGISLNYYCQVIPALTLAAELKRRVPDTFVVVGGGLVCFFDDKWEALAPFRELVDAWVPFEGERPLLELVRALRSGRDLAEVDGLLRFEDERPRYRPQGPPPELEALPPPDFGGLPLGEYFAPVPILPMLSSRGCYWGRCAFCSHDKLYRGRFRKKPADRVFEEMRLLGRRHGARAFYLVDEAIPPATARGLADRITSQGLPYRWFGETRFESVLDAQALALLSAGGCQMLMFGLESAVQRVLDRMQKGTSPEGASRILRDCAAAGIRTFVMFMIGFPGETRAEAERTIRFVEMRSDHITHVAFTNFILEQQSPVHRDPARYDVREILPYLREDLKIYSSYRVEEGLTAEEAVGFLEEARERPGIRALIELCLISRSHLAFLPGRVPAATVQSEADEAVAVEACGVSPPGCLYPLRRPDLTARSVAFDLDRIRASLAAASGGPPVPMERCPSHYVFSAAREKVLEVGEDGIRLLRPCNGRFSLEEILAAVGDSNRETALAFYRKLEKAGFIEWEVRP